MAIINLQEIAQQSYEITTNINKIATELVGIDCIWSRLVPYENGEDVIVQEYTLHSYECPKTLKVVATNAAYQAGDFTIDAFGIHAVAPFEINIDIAEWENVYGVDTMPQQGDFVLVQMMNRPFEVKTTSIIHSVGEVPVSYRCQLTEWKHTASRKEPENFTIDFDKISDSQDRLFGETISKEVADTVAEVETSYDTTTYTDPIKTFDIDSIVIKDIIGTNGNTFANSYYDFNMAEKNIEYNVQAIYDKNVKENHWILSCWFKSNTENLINSKNVKLGNLIKEKDYWYITVTSDMKLQYGDKVTISRGTMINLDGEIIQYGCKEAFTLKLSAADCLITNKKIINCWQSGIWKISKSFNYNILTGYNSDDITFKIDVNVNNITIRLNKDITKIPLKNINNFVNWHYLNIDIAPSKLRALLIENTENNNKYVELEKLNAEKNINISNFEIDKFSIENAYNDIYMTNIRLYENEKAAGDTYKIDMYSQITRNASKLILVDTPRPANKQTFISNIR